MSELAGTAALFRLAWRRDRWIILAVVVVLAATAYSTMAATLDLYSNGSPPAAVFADNPALLAIYGPLPAQSIEGVGVLKTVTLAGLAAAFLAYALVRRHTRTEEESGRLELLAATVVGRRAPLAAALLVALLAVVASAIGCAVGVLASGVAADGAVALGVAVLIAGCVTAGVTAVAVQLTASTRAAGGYVASIIGSAYALRAVGDATGNDWLTWTSYLGWAQKVAPFGANRYWLLLPTAMLSVLLIVMADVLLHHRDLGAGIRAPRPGPARGRIGDAWDLAVSLHKPAVRGWSIGFVLPGLLVGSLVGSVERMASDPKVEDMLRHLGGGEGTLVDVFVGTQLRFAAVAAAAYGISAVLRMRSEERDGHTELLLSTTARRVDWVGSNLVIAFWMSAWLMAAAGVCVSLAASSDDLHPTPLAGAGLACVPAIWTCVALAALLVAVAPRWANAAWAVLAAFVVLGEFGGMLKLPSWMVGISPFAHLGSLPGGSADGAGAVTLLALAAVITALALRAHRRRDIPA